MTNHHAHPASHATTLPIYHPKPVVRPANNGTIPGRSGGGGLPAQFVSQNTAGVFAAIGAVVILSLLLNLAVRLFECHMMPWREHQEAREVYI